MKLENIKLVIFDLDGTLVDAYPAIISSFNYALKKLSYAPLSSKVIRRAVGRGDVNLFKPFVKRPDLESAVLFYRKHHQRSLLKGSRVFVKVYRSLGYLKKRGIKLAVASNRPTKFSWILIRHLGLKKYFNYVLCADKLKSGKPNPMIINKILDKFKLKPKQAIYVGDMVVDLLTGRRAKMKTVIVTTGSSSRKEIEAENPDLMISDIGQLLKIL